MALVHDILAWLWRLLPGNPILVRVVASAGKRVRHLWARAAYLLVLFVVLFIGGQSMLFNVGGTSLAELAKQSTQTFALVSIMQLLLMSFIAPIFAASAITQEKDSNTFHILLTTPLSTGQIVLGTLFSRLFFVFALLLAGVPIFCITMLFGGVTTREVFMSVSLAAATGLVTASLAIMIGIMKVGTRRTIFSFFLGVAVYLLAVGAAGLFAAAFQAPEAPLGTGLAADARVGYLTCLHPFLALFVVIGQTPAPAAAAVQHYAWPWRWLLAYPAEGYILLMTLASLVMIVITLFFVRAGQKEGEPTLWNHLVGVFTRRGPLVEKTQTPRRVWNNPIAWREAKTKASAAGRSMARTLFVIGGVGLAIVLLMAFERGWWGFAAADPSGIRSWLRALVWIELMVILIVVSTTAATALTREKESATLELLLTTRLTSAYILAGMVRGLVSFALPLIAVPTFTVGLFVIADLRRPAEMAVTSPEAVLILPAMLIAFTSLAAVVGLYFSLTLKKSVQAVSAAAVTIMLATGVLFTCGTVMVEGGSQLGAMFAPFAPLNAVSTLVDYTSVFTEPLSNVPASDLAAARFTRLVTSLIAIAVYVGAAYGMYMSMMRSFDMTVRRQST